MDHSPTPLPPESHAELLMLYETAIAEIAGFKQQQWALTYYLLIAQASIVAVASQIGPLHVTDRTALAILAVLLLGLGLWVLRSLHTSIQCRRDRLRKAREFFGEPFKHARAVAKAEDPVAYVLMSVQALGSALVVYLVVARLA